MTVNDPFVTYVGLPFAIILWFVMLFRIKTIWRTGVPYATHNFDSGSPAWRAWVRATVAFVWPGMTGMILIGVAMSLPQDVGATILIGQIGAVLFFGSMLLGLFVGLFNRPKAVVPPPYRHYPGAISEWMAPRRRRRGSGPGPGRR